VSVQVPNIRVPLRCAVKGSKSFDFQPFGGSFCFLASASCLACSGFNMDFANSGRATFFAILAPQTGRAATTSFLPCLNLSSRVNTGVPVFASKTFISREKPAPAFLMTPIMAKVYPRV